MSRTFFRKFFPAVPRAAGRPAFRASALRGGEFGIIRAPGAARAGNPPAHRMPTTPARWSGRDGGCGLALRPGPQPRRFAPAHRRGRPASPRPMPIDATAPEVRRLRVSALRGDRLGCVYSTTYISRRIGLTFRPGVLPPSSRKRSFPYRWRFLIRLRQTPREGGVASREKNGRLRARPPSARAIPSATAPGRFSMSEGFHHFDIEEAKARPPIRMLKHFHRVRSYTCMPNRPWPRS